jgi:hypothetical protein
MFAEDFPSVDWRIVMRGRHHITAECMLEITLYDCGGWVYVSRVWVPDRPHWGDIEGNLAPKIAASISPYLRKASQMRCFLHLVGDA